LLGQESYNKKFTNSSVVPKQQKIITHIPGDKLVPVSLPTFKLHAQLVKLRISLRNCKLWTSGAWVEFVFKNFAL